MSRIPFKKYQGTGNDFVIVEGPIELSSAQIQQFCERKFGVGADGLIIMNRSSELDFDMFYYNSDGSSSFCGNGSRCAVLYAKHHGWISNKCEFTSNDGRHTAKIIGNWVEVAMHNVSEVVAFGEDCLINTGSPHYLSFRDEIAEMEVLNAARAIRYSKPFAQDGINVNFIEEREDGLAIRTYERGVEDETLSCGTGVTAAALAYASKYPEKGLLAVKVNTPGGNLEVKFVYGEQGFHDIYLCGPAQYVFQGEIDLI